MDQYQEFSHLYQQNVGFAFHVTDSIGLLYKVNDGHMSFISVYTDIFKANAM